MLLVVLLVQFIVSAGAWAVVSDHTTVFIATDMKNAIHFHICVWLVGGGKCGSPVYQLVGVSAWSVCSPAPSLGSEGALPCSWAQKLVIMCV